jgi:hypothetical protein
VRLQVQLRWLLLRKGLVVLNLVLLLQLRRLGLVM